MELITPIVNLWRKTESDDLCEDKRNMTAAHNKDIIYTLK